jgi:uncharacterized protein YgbK (DUF1537 family)
LVVVGSHVRRSSEQLAHLLSQPGVTPVEIRVPHLLAPETRPTEITRAQEVIAGALARGETPALYTSRHVEQAADPEAQLEISRTVSTALVDIVRGVTAQPDWVVGKGGITASDIGTRALGARRAIVLGQIQPGVPVWRLGPESRSPGMPYVVFPGNVGGPESLADVVSILRGE